MKNIDPTASPRGFLTRLRRDQRGNVFAIVAAAMIPLAGMIGGGLDISRAYLAKTRLQQACDAGILAGRRMMAAGGTVTPAITSEVQKFVNFNFPPGYLGTAAFTVTPTLAANDEINLALSTQVPTTIMHLFGTQTMAISASCSARNDYANIDIVLVLDTTGSMACKPERTQSQCSSFAGSTKTLTLPGGRTVQYVVEETEGGKNNKVNISRMNGLRSALSALRAQMATIETQFGSAPETSRKRIRWAVVPFSQMVNAGFSTDDSGTTLQSRKPDWFNAAPTAGYWSSDNNKTSKIPRDKAHDANWISKTWDGCVEERGTSNSITGSSGHSIPNNLPSTAYDLKFDLAPDLGNEATRWTMADPSLVGGDQYACPRAMRELGSMSTTDFNNYFMFANGFIANGGTYLDIGLLWAARLLSRTGLWSDSNPISYHSFPVARYVIFMTDGEMDTGNAGYSAYGQEKHWKRVTTDGAVATNVANHTQRMLMTCTAIKNMDVKIYAISFGNGSTLSTDMVSCSSGAGYGYRAADSAELLKAFRDIGNNIGSLRLSQ